ncbi:MAG TPA: SulP family inorganic anion transporter [Thermoanaerobaculia bacterium]|nr:SulP family inorganic anion transporter [Thermoanaerobaculia bacterium]
MEGTVAGRLKARLAALRPTLRSDLTAGLIAAVPAVPDAMASGILAGVGPLHGLYALMVGTPVAALTTGSVYMSVVTTGTMSLAVGAALAGFSGEARTAALVLLTVLVGAFQLALGLLRLGSLTRFVSNAVMTGFLNGVGVLIVLGQLGDVTGYRSPAHNKVLQALDLLAHLHDVQPRTLAVGATGILLIVLVGRTRLSQYAMLVAVAVTAAMVPLLGWRDVPLVGDSGSIPSALPTMAMPDLEAAAVLLVSALAVALLGLVQAAGVSQSYPNPDGRLPSVSRDFVGQGLANVASGVFGGQPVGGSLSSTAIAINSGARTRLANLSTGLFAALIVLLAARVVERLPVASLGALLVMAGLGAIHPRRMALVWRTSRVSRAIMVATFVGTLALPVIQAVFLGVVLSVLLHVFRSSAGVQVVELVPVGGGVEERPAPPALASEAVTVLMPYGDLFFAGAAELEGKLPAVDQARRPVVLFVLRGQHELGSTFLTVLGRYARALHERGGKLMLVGVNDEVHSQLRRTGALAAIGAESVFKARKLLGAALREARAAAEAWLAAPSVGTPQ